MHDVTEYRLTESDEDAMRARMAATVAEWDAQAQSGRYSIGATDREALRRIGAHAIGCSLYDLRDTELQWLDNEIGELDLFR